MKVDGSKLIFDDYPFRCAVAAGGKPVAASEIAEILPERAPPEIWLKSGEILFVGKEDLENLVRFADAHQIPLTSRQDVWSLICEEALDTELSAQSRAATAEALAKIGISPEEARKIRARVLPRLLNANAVWWEWVHLGQFDMLSANKGLPVIGTHGFCRLYDDSMEIARKAPRQSFDEGGFRSRIEACFQPELFVLWQKTLSLTQVKIAAKDEFRNLIRRYSQPGRHYHNLHHIEEVVRHIFTHLTRATDPVSVLWAGWFHDYFPPWEKNAEARSADEADLILEGMGIEVKTRNRVRQLIMLTAGHFTAKDADEMLLADADLQVLGSDDWRYDSYASGVRAEYTHIPRPIFNFGRKKFLRALLTKTSSGGRLSFCQSDSWEAQAVRNIKRELSRL